MMGKYVLFGTIAFIVVVVGMLVYPSVATIINAAPITDFTDLEEAGMVLLSYGFIFFMGYLVYAHIKR